MNREYRDGYGGFDDDVTFGDPYLAGVQRGVGRLRRAIIVGMVSVGIIAGGAAVWAVTRPVAADSVTVSCAPGAAPGAYTTTTGVEFQCLAPVATIPKADE